MEKVVSFASHIHCPLVPSESSLCLWTHTQESSVGCSISLCVIVCSVDLVIHSK